MAADSDPNLARYIADISKFELLSAQQEIDLAHKIKRGCEASRLLFINSNLRLVVKIAMEYRFFGVTLIDLIAEGNRGLMMAVDRFDPRFEAKFSTYGAWWIKQSIKRALANQSRTIRLPVHLVDKLHNLNKVIASLSAQLGHEPTDADICEATGLTLKRLHSLRSHQSHPVSLDSTIGEGDDSIHNIAASDSASPDEESSDADMISLLPSLLKHLNPKERTIIAERFGLGTESKTLEQVGAMFNLTRERIRQIQVIAMKKLRRALQHEDYILASKR